MDNLSQNTENLYSIRLPNENKGESSIFRNPKCKESLRCVPENQNTMLKLFESRVARNNSKNVFSRNRAEENKSGNAEEFTFEEMKSISLHYMDFLIKNNGIDFVTLDDKEWKFVGIYAKNCPEWVMAYIGHWYHDVTTVSLYDTLGLDGIAHILQLTKLTTLVLNACFLDKIVKLSEEGRSYNLKNLILVTDISGNYANTIEKHKTCTEKFNVYDMEKIIESGLKSTKENDELISKSLTRCTADSVLLISFTSGSTGIPKGALMKHSNLANQCHSVLETHNLPGNEFEERHFSYLPYSHIFEQVFFGFTLIRGMNTYYTSGDIKNIVADINRASPTFFIAVPRILLRFYDVIRGILSQKVGDEKKTIDLAFKEKLQNIRNDSNYLHFMFDPVIFDPIRMKLFGRNKLKYMLVASAPIDPEVLDFFKVVLSCPINEAYGMTEETGAVTYTSLQDCYSGHVGGPITAMEIKLIDVPELNYYTTDKNEKGELEPRGEVCARGYCVFKGYLCMKEETDESLDKDGWIHSGDIGVMVNNEKLKIVDRRKNIFKLSQGEYIAPEKVENVMKLSKYAVQSFVYGKSTKSFVLALIIVDKDAMLKLAAELKAEFVDPNDLLTNGKIIL